MDEFVVKLTPSKHLNNESKYTRAKLLNGNLDCNIKLEVFHDIENEYDDFALEVFCNEKFIGHIQKQDSDFDIDRLCFDDNSKLRELSIEYIDGDLVVYVMTWAIRIIEWAERQQIKEDVIPRNIEKLAAIEEFELDCGTLKGSYDDKNIPHEFSKLSNLKKVYLKRCYKLLEFPMQILTHNLKELHLNGCRLISEVGRASSLTSLTVSKLDINQKSLPEEIGDLSNLRYLNVEGENLEVLPDSIGKLVSLEELIIEGAAGGETSSLTTLPDTMANLINLRLLSLPKQCFSDFKHEHGVPECIFKLTHLEVLNIPNMSGKIIKSRMFNELRYLKDILLPRFYSEDIEEYSEAFFFDLMRGRDRLNIYTPMTEDDLELIIQELASKGVHFISTKMSNEIDVVTDDEVFIVDMDSRFIFFNRVFSSLYRLNKMKDKYEFLND